MLPGIIYDRYTGISVQCSVLVQCPPTPPHPCSPRLHALWLTPGQINTCFTKWNPLCRQNDSDTARRLIPLYCCTVQSQHTSRTCNCHISCWRAHTHTALYLSLFRICELKLWSSWFKIRFYKNRILSGLTLSAVTFMTYYSEIWRRVEYYRSIRLHGITWQTNGVFILAVFRASNLGRWIW